VGGAGIVWYWPARTKMVKFFVARDSINCKAQTLTLVSGETILVEAVVVYEIRDLAKLAGETSAPIATIEDVTMGAVLAVIEEYESWDTIRQASIRAPRARDTEFNRRMREEVQKALAPYGVNVLNVMLQNKAKCRVLKLVNSQEG
jgi:regulator of protease activity HflC (stomatin/prohibitin superfamily)